MFDNGCETCTWFARRWQFCWLVFFFLSWCFTFILMYLWKRLFSCELICECCMRKRTCLQSCCRQMMLKHLLFWKEKYLMWLHVKMNSLHRSRWPLVLFSNMPVATQAEPNVNQHAHRVSVKCIQEGQSSAAALRTTLKSLKLVLVSGHPDTHKQL